MNLTWLETNGVLTAEGTFTYQMYQLANSHLWAFKASTDGGEYLIKDTNGCAKALAKKTCQRFEDRITAAVEVAKPKWISVDQLPDKPQSVIIYGKWNFQTDNNQFVVCAEFEDGRFLPWNHADLIDDLYFIVTFWQPLPPAPEVEG